MKISEEFLDKNKKIQDELLDFIRNDENDTESFQNLQTLFDDINIRNDKHDLTTLLHLLTKISNNHHRGPSFFDKIEKIIIIFKDDIKSFFSNSEIFNIFRSNKKILLFLIEEKILIFDEYIAKKITTEKYVKKCYPQYFLPEIIEYDNDFFNREIKQKFSCFSSNENSYSKEEIENCFRKVDKYPFTINFCKFESDGVFVPASALNALRRKVFSAYFESISENNNVQIRQNYIIPEIKIEKNEKTAIICDNLCGLSVDIGILKLNDFNADVLTLLKDFKGEKYLFLPPYLSGREVENVKRLINYFDGIYCDGIYGFKLAEELKKPLFVGTGMNTSNNISVSACKAKYFTLSKELTVSEVKVLSKNNSF